MGKIMFREIRMSKKNQERLEQINEIIEEYQQQGYVLTLRQLYYQLVSRDVVPNKAAEYSKLSVLLKEGRMAGVVDWDAIEDRLRKPSKPSSWDSPAQIIDSCISQYRKPRQEGQDVYLEVWVEKDALSGVLKRVTEKYGIPIVVNRGYSSASAMFDAYNRMAKHAGSERKSKILYLGDFDPSGVDMIRDIRERLQEFINGSSDSVVYDMDFEVDAIALTQQQIKHYNPPPNPAKITDPRAKDFVRKFGGLSWEVDALRPEVLHKVLEDAILENIDLQAYKTILQQEDKEREALENLKTYL